MISTQQFGCTILLSLLAGAGLGELIKCTVPSGNPDRIPLDCQVCLSTIAITSGTRSLPNKELALLEITGSLIIESNQQFGFPLKVGRLEIRDEIPSKLDIRNITTPNLYISDVRGFPEINLHGVSPDWVLVSNSEFSLAGVASEKIDFLVLESSVVTKTSFNQAKMGNTIRLINSTVDLGELFPVAESLGYLETRNSKLGLNMSFVKETRDILLEDNEITSINLPQLEKVEGNFTIRGQGLIHNIHLPELKQINQLSIMTKTESINMSLGIHWEDKSFFNVDNLCPLYHTAFTTSGLRFESASECIPICHSPIALGDTDLEDFKKCHISKDVIIDGDSIAGNVILPSLGNIQGSLIIKNFKANLTLPSLKTISGSLEIGDGSLISKDTFRDVYAESLFIYNITDQVSFELGNIYIEKDFAISSSSLVSVQGVSSKKLGRILIEDNPALTQLFLSNLKEIDSVVISNNTALVNIEATFPRLEKVQDFFFIKDSTMEKLSLQAKYFRNNLILSNNPNLKEIHLPNTKDECIIFSTNNTNLTPLSLVSGNCTLVGVEEENLAPIKIVDEGGVINPSNSFESSDDLQPNIDTEEEGVDEPNLNISIH